MANREHKDITDPNIHEAKGASSATAGQVLTATGLGTAVFQTPPVYSNVTVGWYNVSDTATAGTPIALSVAGTQYDLTNNAAGANTSSAYGVDGAPSVWNTGTNRFDFSSLALGDMVEIEVDISFTTTSANTAIDIIAEFGVGQAGVYNIPLVTGLNIKSASTVRIVTQRLVPMRDTLTKDFPARIRAKADTTGSTVVVNSFIVGVYKRG
jgi:hypothetical protein